MSKFTQIFLCAVALSLSDVDGLSQEERDILKAKAAPIIAACTKENGVTEEEIATAVDAANPESIKPCFLACIFKKVGLIDENGLYAEGVGLNIISKLSKNPVDKARMEEVGKICNKTNDKPVSDGNAGCERAKLLVECVLENRAH